MLTTERRLAWAAGLFDGEGTVRYYVTEKGSVQAGVSMGMAEQRVMAIWVSMFGGKLKIVDPKPDSIQKQRVLLWYINGRKNTHRFVEQIIGDSIVKQPQLVKLMEGLSLISVGRKHVDPEIIKRRREIAAEIKRLKWEEKHSVLADAIMSGAKIPLDLAKTTEPPQIIHQPKATQLTDDEIARLRDLLSQ